MTTHEIVAVWVEKDEKARRISKGDQLSFLRIEVYTQGLEPPNLLTSRGQAVYPPSQVMIELYEISTPGCLKGYEPYQMSRSKMIFDMFAFQSLPEGNQQYAAVV
jgi:hypothetical protein